MNVINNFSFISGLKLNEKKTEAMWIGSAKNNETKPLNLLQISLCGLYAACCVPEMVIKRVQEKITKFLRENKNDKIKICAVICQSLSSGGLNFPNFRTVVKSLRLSWLGRFLNRTNESW